jgi:hypothetical protein
VPLARDSSLGQYRADDMRWSRRANLALQATTGGTCLIGKGEVSKSLREKEQAYHAKFRAKALGSALHRHIASRGHAKDVSRHAHSG